MDIAKRREVANAGPTVQLGCQHCVGRPFPVTFWAETAVGAMALSPLATALDMCQRTQHAHKKAMETVKSLFPASEAADSPSVQAFVQEFVGHLQRTLIVLKREPAVERVIDFMCKFASSNEVVGITVLKVRQSLRVACQIA